MPDFLTISPWWGALIIFVLRVVNITMDTLRIMLTMRNMKWISWILGFFETILFVIAMGAVLDNLDNVLYIVAYAAGFATGNVVGMEIEKRLALGYSQISIISRAHGPEIAKALREHDFAVTEIPAQGKDGTVLLLHCSVQRKKVGEVQKAILDVDPNAFLTVEDIILQRHGYWGNRNLRC
ncbi:MAG: hypothetical protein XD89_0418 [Anaerolineae bacterium 49_20]|nr:MAG: hypothetical protein XD89_0418 [Anaerolineae bacterium 49_20]